MGDKEKDVTNYGEDEVADAGAPEYEDLAEQLPSLVVEKPAVPASEGNGEQKTALTISEAMEQATDLTDMQFAMSKMFPMQVGMNDVMVARIAPDVFLALLHLMSVNEIQKSDPDGIIDVVGTYTRNYVKLSIGLDGRGRIDIAELAGAAKEEKKAMNVLGGMGRGL